MAYHNVNSLTEQNPNAARLNTAALRIKHLQCAPTAKNLAHILNMSRPALYRTFGTEAVWKARKLVRNDALAIREGAEEEVHNRKRRTRPSGAQEGGTLPHD
jgi:hypothetical protein